MAKEPPIFLLVQNDEDTREFRQCLEAIKLSNAVVAFSLASDLIMRLEQPTAGEQPPILFFVSLGPETQHLLGWLEGHPQHRPVGMVGMTTFHDVRPVLQAFHLGVSGFINCPIKAEDLQSAFASIAGICVAHHGSVTFLRLVD